MTPANVLNTVALVNTLDRAVVVAGVLLMLSGCALTHENGITASRQVPVASAAHIVVPASQQDGPVPQGAEWTPDESAIAAMEREIGTLFTHPDYRLKGVLTRDRKPPTAARLPLSDYYVRYSGVERDGQKLVVGYGVAYNEAPADYAAYILRKPENIDKKGTRTIVMMTAFGGGDAYFTALYDAGNNKLLEVQYNAPL